MDNSQLFKQAHQMTKSIIKAGDSYSATFGLCYKAAMAQAKAAQAKPVVKPVKAIKAYPSDRQTKVVFNAEPVMVYVAAILSFAFFLVFCSPMVAAVIGYFAGFTISAKSSALVMIDAFKLASAFGIASLALAAIYSFIGWGEAGDYQAIELA